MNAATSTMPRPRLGVSACLLGKAVRFDGGHQRNDFVVAGLGPHVDWVPVCPEVEAGLGAPRPSMRLEGSADAPRIVEPRSGRDLTETLEATATSRVAALADMALDGFILKKDSPTCGLHRVRVWGDHGQAERAGRGLFAARLTEAMPALPVEEEGRLRDRRLRENFLVRVFTHARLARLLSSDWTHRDLVAFHTDHKMLLLASHPAAVRELGRLVADGRSIDRDTLASRYKTGLMRALSRVTSVGRMVNTLHHMVGHLTQRIDGASSREMRELIDGFGRGEVPFAVPLTLLRHHARSTGLEYLLRQTLCEPCPPSLQLHAAL